MKVSQELKDEFDRLKRREVFSLREALNDVKECRSTYRKLYDFLFGNTSIQEDNENQLQFAKWWAGEEEIEVEEELYYLKLPFSENAYVNLDTDDGEVFPGSKMERDEYRTKFTMKEIENNEKLRQFEKFKKRVDDDD